MHIKIAWKDGEVAAFDIDEENYVDEMFLNSISSGIISLKYKLETDDAWKMWVSYSKKNFFIDNRSV